MKIAIVKLSALGDIVHAMIVLQFIKKYDQQILIDWVIEEAFVGVLEHNPHINQIHKVNLQSVKQSKSIYLLFKELRKIRKFGQYDMVIDMQGIIKSALVSRIISSVTTLGFDKMSLRESLAARFYDQTLKMDYSDNIIARNVALISHALKLRINNEDILYKEPFLYPSKKYSFSKISDTRHNIALIPGASFKSKCYPVQKFVKLTKQIDANFFVVWGNKLEKKTADDIKKLSSNVKVIPKLTLDELISFISQMNLVIGSDTGPTHLAWGLNMPSITLFGPTPGYRNTFTTDINCIIESDSAVNPYKINKNDFSIKNIKVSDIVKMSQYLLKEKI